MQSKKRILLLLLFSMFASFGYAQKQHLVSGTVVDASEEPLVGVAVLLKGKNKGVQTDFDGKFSLRATADDVLVFKYVGMKTQEVSLERLDGAKTLSIVLSESQAQLEEVVISTGFQEKNVETLTGSVVVVDTKMIQNRPATSMQHLLRGVAPGLLVTRSNPGRIGGGGVSIVSQGGGFRGAGGMLVVIDDFPQDASFSLQSINPNDVKTLAILRGAETILYGPDGANGVIVITTKNGGKPKVTVDSRVIYKAPNIWYRAQNIYEYAMGMDESWKQQGTSGPVQWPDLIKFIKDNKITSEKLVANSKKPLSEVPVIWKAPWPDVYGSHMADWDWSKIMYKPVVNYQNSIALQGRIKKVDRPEIIRYRASLQRSKDHTMMRYGENYLDNIFATLNLRLDYRPWLTIGGKIDTGFFDGVNPNNLGSIEQLIMGRTGWSAPFDNDGNPLRWGGFRSPIARARQGGNTTQNSFFARTNLFLDLKPIKGLLAKFSIQSNNSRYKELNITKKSYDYRLNPDGGKSVKNALNGNTSVSRNANSRRNVVARASVSYAKEFANKTHLINLFAVYNHQERDFVTFNVRRRDVLSERIPSLDLASTEDQTSSDATSQNVKTTLGASASYSFKKRYNLSFTYNRYGASNFAEGYKFSNFYSWGVAWNLQNEPLFAKFVPGSLVQEFKLRFEQASTATTGGIGLYDFSQNVGIGQSSILFGAPGSYSRTQVATIGSPSSDERTWALTQRRTFGVNLKLFGKRLKFMGDIFQASTNNAFYTEESPNTFGASMPQINGAGFENNGWDFQIEWNDRIKDFSYNIAFQLSDNMKRTVKLPDVPLKVYGNNAWVKGEESNTIYGYQFEGIMKTQNQVDDYKGKFTAGLPTRSDFGIGDAMYKDMDGDGILESRPYEVGEDGKPTADSGDLIRLKSTNPHYYYNINFGFGYKGFEASVMLTGIWQWWQYDRRGVDYAFPWVSRDKYTYQTGFHPTKRPDIDVPRFYVAGSDWNGSVAAWNYRYSNGAHVQKNVGYLAVQNVQLAYNFPMKFLDNIGLRRFRIYANVSDPGYLINPMSKSYSPEQPFNRNIQPYPVTYSFGIDFDL